MSRKAIVNLVSPIERYIYGQQRLANSFHDVVGWHGVIDLNLIMDETTIGSPRHTDNPYAFKIYAIQKMRLLGYDQVFWADASVVFVKHPKPLFDWISDKGFFFEHAGHMVGNWCKDETLEYFGITREEAMSMPMFSAGLTGLDFKNPIAVEFFNQWERSMIDGQFKGGWDIHRHDMTCGSIIANKMGLLKDFSDAGNLFAYVGGGYSAPKETVIGHLIGI